MKYVHATTMLLCLVGISLMTILGRSYMDPNIGQGLHPGAAGVGIMFFVVAGAWAAGQIED